MNIVYTCTYISPTQLTDCVFTQVYSPLIVKQGKDPSESNSTLATYSALVDVLLT